MKYVAILFALVVLAVVYFLIWKRKINTTSNHFRTTSSNVISMDSHRKAKQSSGEQPCSACKKKNGKLIFYAQDNGTVVGLCKDCQSKAKKRDMLPL
ncbi:hypothetical protein [Paenibacillus sp. FSL R10-2734]|uniref:hypothetical protein n=1 Tax=Paenibacillus sp. FSL R10-2734 TaxID=2954691 RepID=UPI0030D76F64